MGKRYVFWQMPTGLPYRREDDKFAPTALLAMLGEDAQLSDKGISWQSFDFLRYKSVVRSAAVIIDQDGVELNDTDSEPIIWKAITAAIQATGGGKPLVPMEVLRGADNLAAAHFRKPVENYNLLTTLSAASLPIRHVRANGCEIIALSKHRSRYPLPTSHELKWNKLFADHISSTEYRTLKVRTTGRTIAEATTKALDAINLVRGLWTLFATYGSWSMRLGGTRQEPIGAIYIGPIHTLHKPDGSLAEDIYWYEPDYTGDRKLFEPKKGWKRIERDRRWAMRRMKPHLYRRELEKLFQRYVAALDHANLDVAFLQMWSVLEKITDTVGANYDETIRRATWIFPDGGLAQELLEHLRLQRNLFVHAAKTGDQRDQVAYLVKSFVDPHLLRLIRNDFRVESLREYGEFLSLPRQVAILEKRTRLVARATRVRKRWIKAQDTSSKEK